MTVEFSAKPFWEFGGSAAVVADERVLIECLPGLDQKACINWLGFWVVNGEKLKILMCVLASVRNFSVVCFE